MCQSARLKDAGINENLMISVDAANGYWSDEVDRNIPDNVDLNLNFFETNGENFTFPDITMSYGGKNKGENVVNVDKSDDKYNGEKMNHMNIGDATFGISQKAIVSNHAWRKSGLWRGAAEELVSGVIEGAKIAGPVVTEVGTGQFSGNVIKVFNHNGVKVAVDETRKLIMSIRPEKGFQLP